MTTALPPSPGRETSYDVAVVGAGPAGCWAAFLLATRGARVVLVDPSHPREKPCGGGITGRALALVSDAVDLARLPSVRIAAAHFSAPDTQSVRVPLDWAGGGLLVASRTAFDGLLLEAALRAGATLAPTRIVDVTCGLGAARLTTAAGDTITAHRLVGADGANSLVRRRLCGAFGRSQLSIATGYFVHGRTSDDIQIEFVSDPPGYIWSFPRPDHLAVGICAQADGEATVGALRARALHWIEERGLADGCTRTPYSWPIPSLSAEDLRALTVSGRGWFLIGDAAGLVDPITREGIFFALESARFASEAICRGRTDDDRVFADRVHEEIGSELTRAARLEARFFQPRFSRLLVSALEGSAAIRRVMADLVAGTQGYRGLRRRLAGTLEIGLAGRLVADRVRATLSRANWAGF